MNDPRIHLCVPVDGRCRVCGESFTPEPPEPVTDPIHTILKEIMIIRERQDKILDWVRGAAIAFMLPPVIAVILSGSGCLKLATP